MTPPLVLEAAAASEAILKPSQVLSGLLTGNSRTSNRGLFSSSWLHQQRTANIRITMFKKAAHVCASGRYAPLSLQRGGFVVVSMIVSTRFASLIPSELWKAVKLLSF